jgi:hypothetical protein
MSNYYEKKDAKVNIAHELMNRGWNVEGYKEDMSDSMTDYYDPAYWSGIATKNGFVLVVDNRYAAESKEITKYNPKGNLSIEDREKISKLEQMTVERGATAGEEVNAKTLIEKIQSKISGESKYEVVGMTTAHMGNPKGSIWHIEKDEKIYDKGNGLTKFSDLPKTYMFDYAKMQYKVGYKNWGDGTKKEISKETEKAINDFKALILRFERVVMGMNSCGDGTAETEAKAVEQQEKAGYEKITVTESKTVTKPVEVTDRKTLLKDDILSFKNTHGGFWQVIDIWQNNKGVNCYTYEILGSEKRGYQRLKNAKRYYQTEPQIMKSIESGNIIIHTMQTVTENIPVEKWVKIDKSKKTYNTDKKEEQKLETENTQPEQTKETIASDIYTITADTDTRDNSPLWVVKLQNRVDTEEFNRIRNDVMKPINGYYSRFKGGFIFKYDPTSKLINDVEQEQTQTAEEQKDNNNITDAYKQPEIKDGFIYDCHFKALDIPITEIQEAITALNIPWCDMGCKIGFEGLTAEQARQVKEISDKNSSIFFIDKEEKEKVKMVYSGIISINKKFNSIEIKLDAELDKESIKELNKKGFRYKEIGKLLYSLNTEKNLFTACDITGNNINQYKEAI